MKQKCTISLTWMWEWQLVVNKEDVEKTLSLLDDAFVLGEVVNESRN